MRKTGFILIIQILTMHVFSQSDDTPMITKPMGNSQPLIIGHRGGFDAGLPENSISMFDYTYTNSCFQPIGIEFDIRESASGSLFLMHDSTVDRTTNGSGKIKLLPDSYLETLFLKDRNGNITKEKIPLLSEVLTHFKDKNSVLMLDVKDAIYPKVIKLVSEMNMESKCILLTFNQNNTRLVKESNSTILISALVQIKSDWESLLKLQIPDQQLITYVSKKTPSELVNEIYQSKVLVMTDVSENIYNKSKPYDPDYYRSLQMKMHVGIIISDYPVHVSKLFCGE